MNDLTRRREGFSYYLLLKTYLLVSWFLRYSPSISCQHYRLEHLGVIHPKLCTFCTVPLQMSPSFSKSHQIILVHTNITTSVLLWHLNSHLSLLSYHCLRSTPHTYTNLHHHVFNSEAYTCLFGSILYPLYSTFYNTHLVIIHNEFSSNFFLYVLALCFCPLHIECASRNLYSP